MVAFNHEHERQRLSESGLTADDAYQSLERQLWSLAAERTKKANPFSLEVEKQQKVVTATGFAHRGDLSTSYKKSVEEADNEIIAKRYALENEGYEQVKKRFFDLPLYSAVLLFSPPPEHDMRALGYADYSLAYFYHILPGEHENKRTIKALSWVHHFSNEDMATIINQLTWSHMVDPTTESILTSPAGLYASDTGTGSLQIIWEEMRRVYESINRNFVMPPYEVIEEYLLYGDQVKKRDHPVLSAMIEEMARLYQKGKMTKELEEQWRIMLNFADKDLLHQDISTPQRVYTQTLLGRSIITQPQDIFWHYRNLSYEPRAVVTSCGSSGEGDPLRNSISQLTNDTLITTRTFTVERTLFPVTTTSEKTLKCTCPFCQEKVEATIENGKIHCPKCHESAPYEC